MAGEATQAITEEEKQQQERIQTERVGIYNQLLELYAVAPRQADPNEELHWEGNAVHTRDMALTALEREDYTRATEIVNFIPDPVLPRDQKEELTKRLERLNSGLI